MPEGPTRNAERSNGYAKSNLFQPEQITAKPVLGVALVDEREEFGVTRETSEFIDSGIIKVDRT